MECICHSLLTTTLRYLLILRDITGIMTLKVVQVQYLLLTTKMIIKKKLHMQRNILQMLSLNIMYLMMETKI